MGTPQTSLATLFSDDCRPLTPEVATDPIVTPDSQVQIPEPVNLVLSSELTPAASTANTNGGMVPSGYPGGKSGAGVFQKIINQMPPHDLYVEPFLGGGSVMFYKRPALRDVGVDINGGTIARARLLFPQRVELIEGDGIQYLVDLAAGVAAESSGEISRQRVCVYADPPYLMNTRRQSQRRLYEIEAFDQTMDGGDESWQLLDVADALPWPVLLSGYWSELYEERLRGPKWRYISFPAMTHAGLATEYLWCNFPEPLALHDYRYLGDDRRERERINRKKRRWKAKLDKMDRLERYAVLAAIQGDPELPPDEPEP